MENPDAEHLRKVEVCLSPALFPVYYSNKNCVVVVIDVFRATSAIVTAFDNGIKEIIPVSSLEEAKEYKEQGYYVGAERKGEIIEGFDFGNSPFSYMQEKLRGETVVLTTTNGTKALNRAKAADRVIVGSFLNLTAVIEYLKSEKKDVLLLCAGWRDRYNMEDTLFAGAVVEGLIQDPLFGNLADSATASMHLYQVAKSDLNEYLKDSSHRRRLARLNLEKDIVYCLQRDISSNVPILEGNALVIK
ncbi:2-phosphosulfolactate phosphatase [Vicingaceae bacterium]|nr:2-phosphosulfolactate phosphatase [Vicingaceae bacterium]